MLGPMADKVYGLDWCENCRRSNGVFPLLALLFTCLFSSWIPSFGICHWQRTSFRSSCCHRTSGKTSQNMIFSRRTEIEKKVFFEYRNERALNQYLHWIIQRIMSRVMRRDIWHKLQSLSWPKARKTVCQIMMVSWNLDGRWSKKFITWKSGQKSTVPFNSWTFVPNLDQVLDKNARKIIY